MNQKVLAGQDYNGIWKEMHKDLMKAMPEYGEYGDFIKESRLCRLIGLLPFLGRTGNPYRDGFSNLTVYILGTFSPVRNIYSHYPQDDRDVMSRLAPLCGFSGGDRRILARGMHIVALVLLMEYRRHQDEDLRENRYNPLNAGTWDYEAIVSTLKQCVVENGCSVMDSVFPLEYLPFTRWKEG